MAKVCIIQVVHNNRQWIEPVFSAIYNQTFKDFKVVAVIAGSDDGSRELIASQFPQTQIIDPGYNIGFAKGHNLVFEKYSVLFPSVKDDIDFFQLVNPDLILAPDYIEKILQPFADERVGAATGKMYKIPVDRFRISNRPPDLNSNILDTTGVIITKSGRARDRGQHEVDYGQYDSSTIVDAVSGAGAMYRRAALEDVKLPKFEVANFKSKNNFQFSISSVEKKRVAGSGSNVEIFQDAVNLGVDSVTPAAGRTEGDRIAKVGEKQEAFGSAFEFFDEDFHSYWEDVDLSWRMSSRGWKNVFVPSAVGYHGRTAGSSPGGYKKVFSFIVYHRQLPKRIRRLNYKNHIFMYIKNSARFYPQFFIREFFMLLYILLFEISTLKVLPEIFKLMPRMWQKRKMIIELQKNKTHALDRV